MNPSAILYFSTFKLSSYCWKDCSELLSLQISTSSLSYSDIDCSEPILLRFFLCRHYSSHHTVEKIVLS
jgi:hypothetical protein